MRYEDGKIGSGPAQESELIEKPSYAVSIMANMINIEANLKPEPQSKIMLDL